MRGASPTVIEGQLGERQLTHHAWFGYRERVHKRLVNHEELLGAVKCRGLTTKSLDNLGTGGTRAGGLVGAWLPATLRIDCGQAGDKALDRGFA